MLRPESPLTDHRSLLPRRLLPVKTQISPSDKRKNRRSLELNQQTDVGVYDIPKILISKTTDSLNSECPRKVHKQGSSDSLKRSLLAKDDKKAVIKETEKAIAKSDSPNHAPPRRQDSSESDTNEPEKRSVKDVKRSSEKRSGKKVAIQNRDEDDSCRRLYEKRPGYVRSVLPPVAEKSPGSPKNPGGSRTSGLAEGVVRWSSGLLSPRQEPKLRASKSWYGYGTLATDSDKDEGAEEPRSPLELLLGGDLRPLGRAARPVRKAASKDSVLLQPQPLLEGLRKCSTVVSLEPLRPHNRLRAPSVCSRCSSLLSLAGADGSRYSLDCPLPAPTEPVNCKLCLEDASPSELTVLSGCGCIFCTRCMRAYVEFEVCNGAYQVSCPDARCRSGAALSHRELSSLLTPANMEKHLKFRLNHEVAMDTRRTFCPRAGCDTVVQVELDAPATCPVCAHEFCALCNQEWHAGSSCSAAAASSSAPLLANSELIKLCPMCRVPIEKDEGCAQMMCRRCKHVFCWYCLASLDDDFLLRHYDKGPCKNKLGHSRASVLWHRAQVVGIFAGFGLLLLIASPLLLLAAPCIVCCKCRLCNTSSKNLEEVEEESLDLEDDGPEAVTTRYLND